MNYTNLKNLMVSRLKEGILEPQRTKNIQTTAERLLRIIKIIPLRIYLNFGKNVFDLLDKLRGTQFSIYKEVIIELSS